MLVSAIIDCIALLRKDNESKGHEYMLLQVVECHPYTNSRGPLALGQGNLWLGRHRTFPVTLLLQLKRWAIPYSKIREERKYERAIDLDAMQSEGRLISCSSENLQIPRGEEGRRGT